MTAQQNITNRISQIPRALQWMLATLLLIGGFLLWDATVRPVVDVWQDSADQIEDQIATIRDARVLARQLKQMSSTIASIGPVEVPSASPTTLEALTNAVNEVLAEHEVRDDRFASRNDRKFSKKFLTTITRGRTRVESIRGDLSFEADPEEATAIVAALESHPAIECIRTLQMDKSGNGRVEVRMQIEAWGIVKEKS